MLAAMKRGVEGEVSRLRLLCFFSSPSKKLERKLHSAEIDGTNERVMLPRFLPHSLAVQLRVSPSLFSERY